MDAETEAAIDALRAEVAELRSMVWQGGPRLGPRRETQAEIDARTQRLVDAVSKHAADRSVAEEPPPVDRSKLCTTNGKPPEEVRANQKNETGQHDGYIVLCAEERAKGFVRPYRDAYKHKTCGGVTTMGRALSETYARDPTSAAKVPVFVKQLGANVCDRNDAGFTGDGYEESWPDMDPDDIEEDLDGTRDGYQGAPVRVHLRSRKGGDLVEWPADLRVRQFPEGEWSHRGHRP